MKSGLQSYRRTETQEQWTWWKRCLTEALAIDEVKKDAQKLTRPYAVSDLFTSGTGHNIRRGNRSLGRTV